MKLSYLIYAICVAPTVAMAATRPSAIPTTGAAGSPSRMVSMPSMPNLGGSGIGNVNMTVDLPTGPVATNPGNDGGVPAANYCPDNSPRPADGRCVCPDKTPMPYTGKCLCPDNSNMPADGVCKCKNGKPMPENGKCDTKPDKPKPGKPDHDQCPGGGDKNSKYTIDDCMGDMLSCVNASVAGGVNSLCDADARAALVGGDCAKFADYCVDNVRRDCRDVYRNETDVWTDFNSRVIQPNYYTFVSRTTGGLSPYQAEQTCNVLNDGKSGKRAMPGEYARWNCATAECTVRIAAYHKDELITNNWFFGAAGDDSPAVVWQPTGTSFNCGKDLFGFGLLNNTDTLAAAGIPGGALVGAGIGAAVSSGARDFDCNNADDINELNAEIKTAAAADALSKCINSTIAANLTTEQCNAIYDLYRARTGAGGTGAGATLSATQTVVNKTNGAVLSTQTKTVGAGGTIAQAGCPVNWATLSVLAGQKSKRGNGALIGAASGAGAMGLATLINSFVEKDNIDCRVANDISRTGYNKSGRVETLHDYYQKLGLNFPDTIVANGTVRDCDSWMSACQTIGDLNACSIAQVRLNNGAHGAMTTVDAACTPDGEQCISSGPVAVSQNACRW